MTIYSYRAYDTRGKTVTGELEAKTYASASAQLSTQGLSTFELAERDGEKTHARGKGSVKTVVRSSRAPDQEISKIFAGIAALVDAGFDLNTALDIAQQTERSAKLRSRYRLMSLALGAGSSVRESVQAGLTLTPTMAALLDAAEASGKVAPAFSQISRIYADRVAGRKKFISAISYPAFLIVVFVLVLILLSLQLVPAMAPIFEAGDTPMPLFMKALSGFGEFLSNSWRSIFIALLVLCLLLLFPATKSRLLKLFWALLYRIPAAGPFMRKVSVSRYLGSLAMMAHARLPLTQTLDLAASGVSNPSDKAQLTGLGRRVGEGAAIEDAMGSTGIFPNYVISLVALGSKSNTLAEMFERSSRLLTDQIEQTQNRFLAVLSPAITIGLGLLVGSLVISVMSALLAINDVALQ